MVLSAGRSQQIDSVDTSQRLKAAEEQRQVSQREVGSMAITQR